MEFKNLDDKVKIKLVNHIDDTYQDLWEGPLRGCLSEIEKAYNWDYYIEEETFPKEIDDRFILVVPNNKFDFTTNEFIGFINDLGVLNITSCPEGPSGHPMKLKELQIEINEAIEQINIPMLCAIQEHGHGKLIDGELENFSEEHKKKMDDKMQEKVKKFASSMDDVKYFIRQKKDCLKSIEDILLPTRKDRALYRLNKIAKKVGLE